MAARRDHDRIFQAQMWHVYRGCAGLMDDPTDVPRGGLEVLMNGDSKVIDGRHNLEAIAPYGDMTKAENAKALADVRPPMRQDG